VKLFYPLDHIPYILESNPHPFYSFRGLKYQMRIIIACGLDSWSRAGFWKNDTATVRAVRTIQYNNLSWKICEDCIINFRKSSFLGSSEFPSWCLTPADRCLVFLPQSNVAFINSKNWSDFAVSLLLCAPNNFTFELCRIW